MASLLAKQEAARKEIAEVNGGVMPEEAAFGEPNPIYAQVKLRQIEIDTQIEELRRRAAAARTEAEALAAKAEDVPRVEAEFQRPHRDYGIIKSRHDELLSRSEQARMSPSPATVGHDVPHSMYRTP